MTLIYLIIVPVLLFSAFFCIAMLANKREKSFKQQFVRNTRYYIILLSFAILWGIYTFSVFYSRYQHIYEHSISEVCAECISSPAGIEIVLPNEQKYIFIPDNMDKNDFLKYTTRGYRIEKKAFSDTIYLIKGDTTKICLIEKVTLI